MLGFVVNRSHWLWRPLSVRQRAVMLAFSLLAIPVATAAGWYSWQGAFSGTVSTGPGVTVAWDTPGNCSFGGSPGVVDAYEGVPGGMTFTLSAVVPASVMECHRTVRNLGAVPLHLTAVPSVPWVTVDVSPLPDVHIDPAGVKSISITFHFLDTMPAGAVNLPMSIALTLAQ